MARRRLEAEALVLSRARTRLNIGSTVEMTSLTTVADAAEMWIAQLERSDSGVGQSSVEQYVRALGRYVVCEASSIALLSLEHVNSPQRLRAFLQRVADEHGTGSAKLAKTVMSGILNLAVENGALQLNGMRQVRPVRSQRPARRVHRDHRRSMTPDEERRLQATADGRAAETPLHPRTGAKRLALADLIAFMLGTGVRVGEARLLRWEHVDLGANRVRVYGTKTAASRRGLNLPDRLTRRLEARASRVEPSGFVFAAPGLSNPERAWTMRAIQREFRVVLDEAGLSWATTHTVRRTVATKLDEAGFPVRRIADQLGQKDVRTTQSAYLGRDFEGDKSDLASAL